MENQTPFLKSRGIATARRGLKGGRLRPSPLCLGHALNSSQRLNWPRRRPRPNINDGEGDPRDFGYLPEDLDETDRCFTTLSSIGNDEEEPEASYRGPCTLCEPGQRPPQLYPDLETLHDPPPDPLRDPTQEEPPRSSERPPRFRHGPTPAILIAMVILLITSMVGLGHLLGRGLLPQEQKGVLSLLERVHAEIRGGLRGLRDQTQQERHFWIQVLAQLTLLSEESPTQPAVLLGLTPRDAQGAATAACLSQQIVNVVSAAFEDSSAIIVDARSILLGGGNGSTFKEELDTTLQGLNASHAAAIHNLERVPPSAAMIFHAYCDTENAPFKRALILLTLEVDMEYSSLVEASPDFAAHRRLMELWSFDLREDDAAAIVSRVARAPVLFRPEAAYVIHHLCPH